MGMGIEFTAGWMMAGLLVGSIGMGLSMFGKKQRRWPQLSAGLVMMIYPGFVASPLVIIALAGGILGAVWLAVRAGV